MPTRQDVHDDLVWEAIQIVLGRHDDHETPKDRPLPYHRQPGTSTQAIPSPARGVCIGLRIMDAEIIIIVVQAVRKARRRHSTDRWGSESRRERKPKIAHEQDFITASTKQQGGRVSE